MGQRLDGGDAQAVAGQGADGAAAPLAQDAAGARLAHQVPDHQQVVGHAQVGDGGQLVLHAIRHGGVRPPPSP